MSTLAARAPAARPILYAARLGLSRARIEFGHMLTSREDLAWLVGINGILLAVLFFQRDNTVDGVTLAALTAPSLLAMTVVSGGMLGVSNLLAADREDGTLLRAKATPHGMIGYFVARLTFAALNAALGVVVIVVPGLFLVEEFTGTPVGGWMVMLGFGLLGLVATMPIGAIIGSLAKGTGANFGLTFLPLSGLIAISGIFYPITAMPGWIQGVAQVFPVYWLGLGMRSALLPDAAVAAELGGSWRTWQTIAVLGVWAVVGLLVAPGVLRRAARRESGSAVEERKRRVMQRGY